MKKLGLVSVVVIVCFILSSYITVMSEQTQNIKEENSLSNARLQHVMAKLRRGETVSIACMGGSITTGYAAVPPQSAGWANLVNNWWQAKAKECNAKVQYYNEGVSGTDSAAAACRVKQQIIDNKVDFVIVEFAMNDQWLDPSCRKETYEGVLRQILDAPGDIAVMLLFLNQKANLKQGQQSEQEPIGKYYGLPMVSFGDSFQSEVDKKLASWDDVFNGSEVIHPNNKGHEFIAKCINEYLDNVWKNLPKDEKLPKILPVPAPLYSNYYEFTQNLGNKDIKPITIKGWQMGSDIHGEWLAHGGSKEGWSTTTDDALLEFKVSGKMVGIFYSESDQYRNLEAWVDDNKPVELTCYVSYRTGYLGWAYHLIARDLPEGEHTLHIRMKNDKFQGSGKKADIVSIMIGGISESASTKMISSTPVSEQTTKQPSKSMFTIDNIKEKDWQFISADNSALYYIGRIDTNDPKAPILIWQGTEVRANFSGKNIGFKFENASGQNFFNVIIDGKITILKLNEGGTHDYLLTETLPAGQHELILYKRTESIFSKSAFCGLILEKNAKLGSKPQPLPLRIEFFGDSMTAGACNEDPAEDQYADYSTHNNYLSYGSITARNLNAEYISIAVSGTGICYSWNPIFMADVYDKLYPDKISKRYDFSGRKPDIVVINLGQNDYGYPASKGLPFPSDFTEKYVPLVRNIRSLYPDAKIVCVEGGMSAYHDSKELQAAFGKAIDELKTTDNKLYSYIFTAFSYNHPRVDTHAKLAEELTAFLKKEILGK